MERGRRIRADQAPRPGWYRSKNGSRIKLLKEPLKAHHPAFVAGRIPYLSPGNPRAKSAFDRIRFLGWLNPEYLLLPIRKKEPKPC